MEEGNFLSGDKMIVIIHANFSAILCFKISFIDFSCTAPGPLFKWFIGKRSIRWKTVSSGWPATGLAGDETEKIGHGTAAGGAEGLW